MCGGVGGVSTLTFRRRVILFGKILVRSPTDFFFAGEPFASKMFKLTTELLFIYFRAVSGSSKGEECDIINRTEFANFSNNLTFSTSIRDKKITFNFEKLRNFIC